MCLDVSPVAAEKELEAVDRFYLVRVPPSAMNGLAKDEASEKSLIPCLEPCAVLLEFARAAARLEQQEKRAVSYAPGEIETLAAALKEMINRPRPDLREADFAATDNPRRAQLLLEKLKPGLATKSEDENK